MKRKHYLAWMLTAALTAASVMPMTVYAQPASAGGGKVKVVEGDVSGEMQGGVMSPGAVAVEGADLTVNGNVSDGLVSDGATLTVNGNVTGNGINTVVAKKGTVTVNGGWRKRIDRRDCRKRVESDSRKCESFRGIHDRSFGMRRQHGSCKR